MNNDLNGFVVYCKDANKTLPLGIVSNDYTCKAISRSFPSRFKKFLVHIEDKRFYGHHGIDLKGITRAAIENIKAGKIVQGGSSITQQLARNLLKDHRKLLLRKIKETVKALNIEFRYSKNEILDMYFNNVFFGKNLWGIRAAGLHYFGKEIHKLTQTELLVLLTILRGPNYYLNYPDRILKRFKLLSQTLYTQGVISESRHKKNLNSEISIGHTDLQSIRKETVPFILKNTDFRMCIISSTIEKVDQDFAIKFVLSSKYPVSIVTIRDKKVVAFASSYGSDYPFISRSNVGSTLKPFLYCHLRECGVTKGEKFSAWYNTMEWDVREAGYGESHLSIQDALFYSNNNSFINACDKVGIETSLRYLSHNLNRKFGDFFPSSILGATKSGISLYELAIAYADFFDPKNLSEIKKECLLILNKIAKDKLGFKVDNAFLKTGTTNNNRERLAILMKANTTYAILRSENPIDDSSKDGGFIKHIKKIFRDPKPRNYKW